MKKWITWALDKVKFSNFGASIQFWVIHHISQRVARGLWRPIWCIQFYRVWRYNDSSVCRGTSVTSSQHLPTSLTRGLDFLLDNAPYRKYEFVSDSSNEHDECVLLSVQDLNLNPFLFIWIGKGYIVDLSWNKSLDAQSQLFPAPRGLQAERDSPMQFWVWVRVGAQPICAITHRWQSLCWLCCHCPRTSSGFFPVTTCP